MPKDGNRTTDAQPGEAVAERRLKTLFDRVAAAPAPRHLVDLANRLEEARRASEKS